MSLVVRFDEAAWPDAPSIGGIAWAADQMQNMVMPEAMAPWARWLLNGGDFGLDGRGHYLFPTLARTAWWNGDDPARERAALNALAAAFPGWRAGQPEPEAWLEWEHLLNWAAAHYASPYIWGW